MEPQKQERAKVFISYSRRDARWLDRLRIHLKPLERDNKLDVWDDTKIKAGSNWREEIEKAINNARIVVLLVSADFLASDFIQDTELPPLLKAAQEQGATIFPLILSPCRFAENPNLSQYQAVNDPSTPLIKMSKAKQEEILVKLTKDIEASFSVDEQLSSKELPIAPSKSQEVLGYSIMGVDDEDFILFFNLFGDPPPETQEAGSEFEEICFNDFGEMNEVFRAVKRITENANDTERKGGDRQKAFERAWLNECISRATRYALAVRRHEALDPEIKVPGLRYIVWGVRRDYARMIRALRPQERAQETPSFKRDAHEVYFKDINVVPQIPNVINRAVQDSKGDDQEFLRLLFEAAMRLRLFGSESEAD